MHKPSTEFYTSVATTSGYQWACKVCQNAKSIKWHIDNPEKTKLNQKNYHANMFKTDPVKAWARKVCGNSTQSAKRKGFDHNLTPEYLMSIAPKRCPVFGVVLRYGGHGNARFANSASLDRINNSLGYIIGNVVVISWRANELKRDATVDELEALVAYMKIGVE